MNPTEQPSSSSSRANKNIPITSILDCIETKGLTQAETAKYLNCHPSNISKRLKEMNYQPGYLKAYKNSRADIFAYCQSELLNSITADDIKKASFSQKMMGFGILYDKERLERGHSTANISTQAIVSQSSENIEKISNELKGLIDKVGPELLAEAKARAAQQIEAKKTTCASYVDTKPQDMVRTMPLQVAESATTQQASDNIRDTESG